MVKRKSCNSAIFASDQKALHADAKVIIALLRKQPQTIKELCKNAGIDVSTFYRMRRLLLRKRVIKETDKGYVLWFYRSLEDKVREALKSFKDEGYEMVSINDLANRAGEHPAKIEELAYKIAPEYEIKISHVSKINRGTPYLRRVLS